MGKLIKRSREAIQAEYDIVKKHPITKGVLDALIFIIDVAFMGLLIWNLFAYFIPVGSWISFVKGDSMYPTMKNNQIIFADMAEYDRGDIITAHFPDSITNFNPEAEDTMIVKRIVGIPGDKIEITKDGVYINGDLYEEPYLTDEHAAATYVETNHNKFVLGDNDYFIMGDNRDESFDSREFGVVKVKDILYKQSETPTSNFYLKLILIILVCAFDVALYALIEFTLTELAYALFFKKEIDAANAAKREGVVTTVPDHMTEINNIKNNEEI